MSRKKLYIPPLLKLEEQSKVFVSKDNEKIHYSVFSDNVDHFIEKFDDRVENLYDSFVVSCEQFGKLPCLGTRTKNGYEWVMYNEVLERAKYFGSGLLNLGLNPGQSTFIGVYAKNRVEWDLAALSCCCFAMVVVPLYDTLGPDAASFIINQGDIELLICDNVQKVDKLLQNREKIPKLKYVVLTDDCDVSATVWPNEIKILKFGELEKSGLENPKPVSPPKPDDLYIICYTSGTTGTPKGVMISHKNVIGQLAINRLVFEIVEQKLTPADSFISYLPMAHMLNQMMHIMCFSYGAKVGYLSGAVTKLMDDMQELKPTFFVIVPRLLNRLYDGVMKTVEQTNFLSRKLFHLALDRKMKLLSKGEICDDTIWDRIVFKRVRQMLGGHVRFMITGSAPVLPKVKQFAWCALGQPLVEAYGQTEVTAGVTVTWPHDTDVNHVGAIVPNCVMKLADVPDLEYYAKDDVGEICIKGPCFTKGYFKEPEKTAELFDAQGWLRTGDIGRWNPNGTLSIIDRRKNILKLAQGEYVAPERIESVYSRCPLVSQIFVDGCSLETCLVAIVVPERNNNIAPQLQEHPGDENSFWQDAKAEKFILEELRKVGQAGGLSSLEQVKAVRLSMEAFTLENDLLTPTMKSRRPMLRKRFAKDIEDMYKNMKP